MPEAGASCDTTDVNDVSEKYGNSRYFLTFALFFCGEGRNASTGQPEVWFRSRDRLHRIHAGRTPTYPACRNVGNVCSRRTCGRTPVHPVRMRFNAEALTL